MRLYRKFFLLIPCQFDCGSVTIISLTDNSHVHFALKTNYYDNKNLALTIFFNVQDIARCDQRPLYSMCQSANTIAPQPQPLNPIPLSL